MRKLLTFYKLFCFLNYPIWVFVLVLRRLKGKEHKERYREKLGYYKYNRPKNEVIWVNSLGLGETLSLTGSGTVGSVAVGSSKAISLGTEQLRNASNFRELVGTFELHF